MNYIIEDNINFFEELNNTCDDNNNISDTHFDNDNNHENECLISYKPLDENSIKLHCGHRFDFNALYIEISNQKTIKNRYSNVILKTHQIKCPYCRNIQDSLLPHIKINSSMNYIYGVNSPVNYCMDFHKCSYIFKSGKNKNTPCMNSGFYKNTKCLCSTHHKVQDKTNQKKVEKNICTALLKSGKNKGLTCKCKARQGSQYCNRHIQLED